MAPKPSPREDTRRMTSRQSHGVPSGWLTLLGPLGLSVESLHWKQGRPPSRNAVFEVCHYCQYGRYRLKTPPFKPKIRPSSQPSEKHLKERGAPEVVSERTDHGIEHESGSQRVQVRASAPPVHSNGRDGLPLLLLACVLVF